LIQTGASSSALPKDAVFSTFGVPAINRNAELAFAGSWTSSRGNGTAIFVDGMAVLKSGDPVPGLQETNFQTFADPVLTDERRIAVLAKIKGAGVTNGNDDVVVSNTSSSNGEVQLLARREVQHRKSRAADSSNSWGFLRKRTRPYGKRL
jgi:hypothetical protein